MSNRRNRLIALGLLFMIISATLLLTTVQETDAKALKKLKKLLKLKKLKKYLPFILMGPKILVITQQTDHGHSYDNSYGSSGSYGGSGGGGGGYDDGGYGGGAVDPGFDYGSMGY